MAAFDHPALATLPVKGFLDRLAAAEPAPGGGSAAALAGALAAGLLAMVAAVTLAKAGDDALQAEMTRLAANAAALQNRLTRLIDEDAAAYAHLTAAYRLPHATPAAAAARDEAVQGALYGAVTAPLAVAEACRALLVAAHEAAERGSRLAVPDAAMAAHLAQAALAGSVRNAVANLAGLADPIMRQGMLAQAQDIAGAGEAALAAVLAAADARA